MEEKTREIVQLLQFVSSKKGTQKSTPTSASPKSKSPTTPKERHLHRILKSELTREKQQNADARKQLEEATDTIEELQKLVEEYRTQQALFEALTKAERKEKLSLKQQLQNLISELYRVTSEESKRKSLLRDRLNELLHQNMQLVDNEDTEVTDSDSTEVKKRKQIE